MPRTRPAEIAEVDVLTKLRPYVFLAASGHVSVSVGGAVRRPLGCWERRDAGVKLEKSKVPSWTCVTGMDNGLSSPARTSVNADRAEQTVASGAWNGGFIEDMIEGVKTRTFGCGFSAPEEEVSLAVRRGRNAWMVSIGWRRCVLKRSAKLDGGIVAIGDVW